MQEDEYRINHEGREITRIPDMVTIPSHVHIPSTQSLQKVFDMPQLGVTFLGTSHGFDASGTTTGFILWSGVVASWWTRHRTAGRSCTTKGSPLG